MRPQAPVTCRAARARAWLFEIDCTFHAGRVMFFDCSQYSSLVLIKRLNRGGILQVLANKLTKLPCHFRAISHGRQCITKRVCNQSFCDVFTEAQVQQNVQHWIDRLDDGSEYAVFFGICIILF